MNLETKVIWTHVKNGLNLDLKKFFDDWNLHCHQEIIAVYQNMQNKTSEIWIGPTDVKFEVNVVTQCNMRPDLRRKANLDHILTPKRLQFWGQFGMTSINSVAVEGH